MSGRYFAISFPGPLVKEPVLYSLVRRYEVTPNVYRAKVTGEGGWLIVSLEGARDKVDGAVLDLRCRGAQVREGGPELLDMEAPAAIHSVRARLSVPAGQVKEPLLAQLIRAHDVVVNIRQARVDRDRGVVELELSGTLAAIDRAVDWLKKSGVAVDPIEGNVIE